MCERIQYGLSSPLNSERKGYKTFRMNELVEGKCVDYGSMKYADISAEVFEKYQLRRGDVLFNRTNSFEHVGRTGIFDLDGLYCFASYLIRLSVSENIADPFYVNAFMNTANFQAGIKKYASRAIGQSNINAKSLAAYLIPLPQLETQHAIVSEIQAEQSLVDANRQLIERFEKKIRDANCPSLGELTVSDGMKKIQPLDSLGKEEFFRPASRLIEAQYKQYRSYHERPIQRDMFADYDAIAAWGTVTCCYSGIEQAMKCLLQLRGAFKRKKHWHHCIGKLFRELASEEQDVLRVSYAIYRSLHDYIPPETVDCFLNAIDDGYNTWRYFLLMGEMPPTTHPGAMLEIWSALTDILLARSVYESRP